MKTFQSHIILALCSEHLAGISHVCMQCVQDLCVKCLVLDHKDPEYNEGMEKCKSELRKMNNKLNGERATKEKRCSNKANCRNKSGTSQCH